MDFPEPSAMSVDDDSTRTPFPEVNYVYVVVSSFSLIGAIFIILSYRTCPDLQTFAYGLVYQIGIGNFFYALASVIGDAAKFGRGLCFMQAMFNSDFSLTSCFWSAAIAVTLHGSIVLRLPRFSLRRITSMKRLYLMICWGVPLFLTLLPLAVEGEDVYYEYHGICWIPVKYRHWQFIQFYVPLWIIIVYNTYVTLIVIRVVRRLRVSEQDDSQTRRRNRSIQSTEIAPTAPSSATLATPSVRIDSAPSSDSESVDTPDSPHSESQRSRRTFLHQIRYFPLILVGCYTFATINRIYLSANPDNPPVRWLIFLHVFGVTARGVLDALVFGGVDQVRDSLRRRWKEFRSGGGPAQARGLTPMIDQADWETEEDDDSLEGRPDDMGYLMSSRVHGDRAKLLGQPPMADDDHLSDTDDSFYRPPSHM